MRLIDADALFREMEKAQWYNNADRDEIAEELVLNAPTIEPQRTGRWIDAQYPYSKCSICGEELDTLSYEANYCPKCGARMENM